VLLEHVPRDARRILDLGTGDGRLLALLRIDRPEMHGVGLDLSEPMLKAARKRFADNDRIELELLRAERFDDFIADRARRLGRLATDAAANPGL
jgi:ubiquinone/menaquinone biosynthesis C-methylase UbiE